MDGDFTEYRMLARTQGRQQRVRRKKKLRELSMQMDELVMILAALKRDMQDMPIVDGEQRALGEGVSLKSDELMEAVQSLNYRLEVFAEKGII